MASSIREELKKKYGTSNEEKKESGQSQQKQASVTVPSSNSIRSKLKEKYSSAYSHVDEAYIQSFLKDAQSFLDSAESAYNGIDYTTKDSVYEDRKKKTAELRSRSWDIRQYLKQNKDSLKAEDYSSLVSMLDDFDQVSSSNAYAFYNAKERGFDENLKYSYMSSDEIKAEQNSRVKSEEDKNIIHELMLSGMPYNREYAEQDGIDMGLYDEVEKKRKYISDKYGIQFTESSVENDKILTSLMDGDVIAYTTRDGQNVTWDSLYTNAVLAEDLASRYETYSQNADWDQFSKSINTVADTESDYSIVFELSRTLVPYDWETAEANGVDRATYDNIEKKRQYISNKYGVDLDSDIYNNINILNDIMAKLDGDESEKEVFEFMPYLNDEEKAVLSYIYETEGRAAALEWHNSRKGIYQSRSNEVLATGMSMLGKENPFWGSVGSVALSLGSSVEYLTDVFDYMATGEAQYNTLANASSSIRSGVMESVDLEIGNWDAFDFLYSTGMSMADSATSMAVGGNFGGVILGLGAAAQATNDALNRGMNQGQAFWNGLIAGTFEGLFESWSIGKFNALKEVSSAHGKDIALNIAKSMLVNASEETLTEIANIAYDSIFNGDFSQYETMVRQYVVNGYSEEEAKRMASQDLAKQVVEAGASGMLMGFGFGAIGSGGAIANNVKSSVQSAKQTNAIAKGAMETNGGVDALIKLANEVAGVSSPKLENKLTKLSGKVENKATTKNVGKLYNTVGAAYNAQNKADIVTVLEMNRFDSKQANDIADAIVAAASGQQLTNKQAEILRTYKDNDHVKGVINSYDLDESHSIGKRNKTMSDFASDIAIDMLAKKYMEKQATPSGKYAVAEKGKATVLETEEVDGKTITKDTGEVIDIKGVASVRKGEMLLDIGDGKTINSKNVAYASKKDALIYEAIANLGDNIDAETANKLISKYDGRNAMVFARGIAQAYSYGFYGYDRSEMMGKYSLATELSEEQRNFAYGLGEKYRPIKDQADKAAAKVTKAPGEKGVYYRDKDGNAIDIRSYLKETKIGLKGVQKTAIEAMEKMSAMLGVRFNVFESWEENGKRYYLDENGVKTEGNPNGFYDTTTGEIYIDLNAGNDYQGTMLFTVAHELAHFMKQWSPEQFTKISKLVFQHGGMKGSVAKLAAIKQLKASSKGKPISYDTAVEEVVADGMETILKDGKVLEFMADVKKTDHEAWAKLKEWFKKLGEFLKKMVDAYKSHSAQTVEGAKVAAFSEDLLNQIKQIYAEGAVAAGENYQAAMENVVAENAEAVSNDEIITDGAVVTDGEGTKFSIKSMKHDIAEGQMFEDLKKYCGWTNKQVNELRKNLNDLVEYMTPFRDILDMNESYDRDGRRFSPYKPNSDPLYKISMDFSTLCSKRLLTQFVIENLQLRENRPMSAEEQMAIRDMLNEYRKVEKGLQVACAMCYVEAARLKSPNQIQKWLDDPATQMKNYFADKNPEFAAFIKEKQEDFKESRGYARNATKKDMSAKDVRELNKIRPRLRSQYQITAEEQAIVDKATSLPNSTYLTAANLAELSESDPTIYAAYTAFVRTATRSKSLETDEPYYYGDSRRDNGNGIIVSDSFIEAVNRENGMRFSSWSDWRIQHLLDYIAAVIDNSVRGAAMHGYTKFGEEVRVLGKTGMMFNMSGVAGTQTGLNEDGSLSFSPTESVDVDEAIQLRDEFPETAGLQCIGVSDEHIIALLRSDIIDYIIPYHVSGLNAALRRMADIFGWADYTSTQHAAIDKSISKENAVDPEHWHEEPAFSEFFVGYNTGMTGVEAMKASADRYVQMCKDRGLKPKFEQFVKEKNYWKLLIDRKMINQKTGNLIQQKAVTPTFDFDAIKEVVDRHVQNYDSGLESRALNHIVENWDSIPQRIKDLKKQGGTKAKKASKAVDTLSNQTLAAQPTTKNSDRQNGKIPLAGKETVKYSDTRFFPGNVFPSGLTHTSVAEWAMRKDIKTGDKRLVYHRGAFYRVEKFDDMDFKYLITKKYDAQDYNEELREYGEIDSEESVQERIDRVDALYRETDEYGHGRYHAGSSGTEYGGENLPLLSVDQDTAEGRGDPGNTERDRQGGLRDQRQTGRETLEWTPQELYDKMQDLDRKLIHASGRHATTLKNQRERYASMIDEMNGWDQVRLSDRDSDGNQLTVEQHEFFKDSVVRDADGKLMVMYHGTANGGAFTVFDGDKLGNDSRTSQVGQGFYFTNMKKEAEAYTKNVDIYGRVSAGKNPHLHQVYLNITNPFDISSDKLDINKVKSVYMDGTRDYFFSDWIPFYLDKKTVNGSMVTKADIQAMSKTDKVSAYVDYLSNVGIKEVLSNMVRAYPYGKQSELLASMKNRLGYDGIVEEFKPGQFQYVAFSSEQIKSVDNQNPTSDPDIRYSDRDFVAYDRTAILKEETVDRWLRAYATKSTPNYAQAYIAYMNPDQFLELTTSDYVARKYIESQSYELDEEKFVKATSDQPLFLDIDHETGEVYGHEGRHRCVALQNAGIENVPVLLFDTSNKYSKEDIPSMLLKGQFNKYHREFVFDAIPLSYENQDRVVQNFATQSSSQKFWEKTGTKNTLRFQDRDTDSVSNRSLLANAFEGVAQNEIERNKIQEYKSKISLINAEERKLSELNEKIKELSFAKGPRDSKAIRDLQFEARQTANRISTYDKQLLRLEASKPLQDVLTREKKMAYQRAEKKGKEALEAYREKTMKTQRELLEKWQESRKKGVDSRHRTAMRHKIKDVVNELNQYLLRGTKDRHVPIELQKAVAEALDAVNMDTVGAEERIAKLKDELLKAKTPEQIQEISRKIDHIQQMGDKMNNRLQKLKDAYDQFVNSDDPLIANSHDEVISNKLQSVIDSIGNTPLRDMTLSQLEDVYDMYRMVLTTIRNANKAFKAKKSESISTIANQVMVEVEKVGGKQKQSLAMLNGIKSFGWNNLKPVYAFEHIGSDSFTEVFNNVRAGEDVWAVDVTEAREFYLDKSKKHNYDSWDLKKRHKFTSTSGMDFELDLEQIMSLYAYSKRDQAADHLSKGGIVFDESTKIIKKTKVGISLEFNPTEATAYNISEETLADIVSKLTDEQKGFVDEMQDYLSTVMGAKGNEVSLEMYGVKLFKEKFYFPLKSAQQFMAKAKEQQKGEVKIKNSGFSKETVQKASNPIVLTPFMNVWADHVNEMSMYHAFVLPMEDFYRVYNYKTPTSDTMATESVEMFIQNAYGKGATKYIDQLLKDLNGGARTDSTTGFINKMIGLFKKGAVFASLSVVVQQPSAIARAVALVDTKYFIGPKVDHKRHKALWSEVKQCAPVAIIKEMGYFDTNMGKSTQDFILGKEYAGFKDKMSALLGKDSNYRDELLSKAPSLADEIAWCGIWEAVKRETQAKNPGMDVKSEAFLKMAGERFTEVIVKTQVYDSVLSRSGLMRSKDTGMKMATAFMAEPTTSINMVADALLQGKRGNRKYARTAIGAVIASQIINSILVSFVYAGRDDDEDETYLEKYIGTLTGEILDSLNPATYIPFIKDIVSIVQGYDVERSDMAVVSDLWNAWENLSKGNVSAYRKVEGFAGSVAQIFGLPVKNIMRDARGIYQTVMSFVDGEHTTAAGIGHAVKGAITGKDVSDSQQLYDAYLSGDAAQIARVKGRLKDQNAINNAIRKALRENDPRIKEAAIAWNANDLDEYMRIAKEIIAEKHFVQDDVVMAIRSEANALAPDAESETKSKAKGLFTAEKFAEAIAQGDQAMANAVKVDIIQTAEKNGQTADDAEKSFNNSAKNELKEMFLTGDITEQEAISALTTYCGSDEDGAMADVQYWAFKHDYPDIYADDQWFDTYYEKVADSGISIDVYMEYRNTVSTITGENKKTGRMAVINSLPISSAQKDALYYAEGWAASKLYEAPWH